MRWDLNGVWRLWGGPEPSFERGHRETAGTERKNPLDSKSEDLGLKPPPINHVALERFFVS